MAATSFNQNCLRATVRSNPDPERASGTGPVNARPAPVRAVTSEPGHHSFGYYDKTPWDASGRYLLALRAPFCHRSPGPDDPATLGVVDLLDGDRFKPFAETRAWNWQQGCMLQWLPGTSSPLVIYNDREGDRFVALIRDALSGELVRRLPLPVYAINHDGRQALTLNFARLHHQRPGYGYAGPEDRWRQVGEPGDDGIVWMDLESGEHQLIVSVADAASLARQASQAGAIHRFNHLQFSPDDSRLVVLLRWRPVATSQTGLAGRLRGVVGGTRRLLIGDDEYAVRNPVRRLQLGLRGLRRVAGRHYGAGDPGLTRMLTARVDGSDLRIVADEQVVSHFDWRDDRHLLAWARHGGVEGFFLFDALTGAAEAVDPLAMPRDGHCSYSADAERRWILNDTAPDEQDQRALYLYDTRQRRRIELGRFYSPPRLQHDVRCDLHPRWSRDGRQVCIDSAHQGSRQLYVVDLTAALGPA